MRFARGFLASAEGSKSIPCCAACGGAAGVALIISDNGTYDTIKPNTYLTSDVGQTQKTIAASTNQIHGTRKPQAGGKASDEAAAFVRQSGQDGCVESNSVAAGDSDFRLFFMN